MIRETGRERQRRRVADDEDSTRRRRVVVGYRHPHLRASLLVRAAQLGRQPTRRGCLRVERRDRHAVGSHGEIDRAVPAVEVARVLERHRAERPGCRLGDRGVQYADALVEQLRAAHLRPVGEREQREISPRDDRARRPQLGGDRLVLVDERAVPRHDGRSIG